MKWIGIGARLRASGSAWARSSVGGVALMALASCGGGGGAPGIDKPIPGSVSYSATVYLWRQSSLRPDTSDIGGIVPECSLRQGSSLPPGLAFGPGCTLVGSPTVPGFYLFEMAVTAAGYTGQAPGKGQVTVVGPSINWELVSPEVGTGVVAPPVPTSGASPWTPATGEAVSYSLASGSLPAGLRLDAATGVISGVATGPAGSFTISVVAQSAGRTYTATSQSLLIGVQPGLIISWGPVSSLAGFPINSTPYFFNYPGGRTAADYKFANWRLSASSGPLPPGMSLDTRTGAIAGAPAAGTYPVSIDVDVSTSGQTGTMTIPFAFLIS